MKDGTGAKSLGPITELVHRCRKEEWEKREREKIRNDEGLLGELVRDLEDKRERAIQQLTATSAGEAAIHEASQEFEQKIESLRDVFHRAGVAKRRKVPEWCIDDITFAVMSDPVVVSLRTPFFTFGFTMLTVNRPRQDNPTIDHLSWNISNVHLRIH